MEEEQSAEGGKMKTLTLLTPHLLENLAPQVKEYTLFDAQCDQLALRVQPSGSMSWVMWERQKGKTRRITLGKYPDLSPKQARQALHLRKSGAEIVVHKAETTIRFAELAALFVDFKLPKYKVSARGPFKDYLRSQLIPAFGNKEISKITTPMVADWFYNYSRERSGGANQAIGHFTTMYNWGKRNGHIPFELKNPASPIKRNKTLPRGKMLNSEQLKALWEVLERPPIRCAPAADPLKLMLLTACRRGEILGLTWKEVKLSKIILNNAKQGPREVPLNRQAKKLLKALKYGNHSRFVFPSSQSESGHVECIDQAWLTIKSFAGLAPDFRIHDLRHTYASHAILSGESIPITGQLLGHRSPHSTQRYAHLDGSTLAGAAQKVSKEIEKMLK